MKPLIRFLAYTAPIWLFAGGLALFLLGQATACSGWTEEVVRGWVGALSGYIGGAIAAAAAIYIGREQLGPLLADRRRAERRYHSERAERVLATSLANQAMSDHLREMKTFFQKIEAGTTSAAIMENRPGDPAFFMSAKIANMRSTLDQGRSVAFLHTDPEVSDELRQRIYKYYSAREELKDGLGEFKNGLDSIVKMHVDKGHQLDANTAWQWFDNGFLNTLPATGPARLIISAIDKVFGALHELGPLLHQAETDARTAAREANNNHHDPAP